MKSISLSRKLTLMILTNPRLRKVMRPLTPFLTRNIPSSYPQLVAKDKRNISAVSEREGNGNGS